MVSQPLKRRTVWWMRVMRGEEAKAVIVSRSCGICHRPPSQKPSAFEKLRRDTTARQAVHIDATELFRSRENVAFPPFVWTFPLITRSPPTSSMRTRSLVQLLADSAQSNPNADERCSSKQGSPGETPELL